MFGPVLHVLRFERDELDGLIAAINANGYGLTFGLHTRIDETIARVTARIGAGNIYVNRNVVGAMVGVQPFGGNGLSGTGPKAGGPLYLRRLLAERPPEPPVAASGGTPAEAALAFHAWLAETGRAVEAERCARVVKASLLGSRMELPGPVGERNVYSFRPRGTVLAAVQSEAGLFDAIAAALATGNRVEVRAPDPVMAALATLPQALAQTVRPATADGLPQDLAAVLFEGDGDDLVRLNEAVADRPGAIVPVHGVSRSGHAAGREEFPLELLVEEVSISTNTAAAGGNASLMSIG